MKRLSILLQNRLHLFILMVITIVFCILFTNIYDYKSNYTVGYYKSHITINEYHIDGDILKISFSDKEDLIGYYSIKSKAEKEYLEKNIKFGTELLLEGELRTPSNNTVPNLFNYKEYLINKKIYCMLDISVLKILGYNEGFKYKVQNYFFKRCDNYQYSYYFKALLFGYKKGFDNSTFEIYNSNGVIHLLALSGLHVSVLVFIIDFILKKINIISEFIDIILIIVLFLFAYISFSSVSIYRAVLMFSIYKCNILFNLNLSKIDVLSLTCIMLLLINPLYIYDIGFQFSFTTVFFILTSYKIIKSKYIQLSIFKLSFIAFFSTLPITVNINYEVNFISPFINYLVVQIFSIIVFPITIITFIFRWIEPLFNLVISVFEKINLLISYLDFGTIIVMKMNYITIILYYLFLINFLVCVENKRNLRRSICLFIFYLSCLFNIKYFLSTGRVIFLDVGQGDSTIIDLPYNKGTILIDTGGIVSFNRDEWKVKSKEYSIVKEKTIPYLKSLGIRKLDYVILTHGDYDHIYEYTILKDNFRILNTIINCNQVNKLEERVLDNIDYKRTYRGEVLYLNNYTFNVELCENNTNENNSSIVLSSILGPYKFLFTGDIENENEEKISLDVDVLKVAHHGSKTSTTNSFLLSTSPKYSIISAGRNNRYGHPHDLVISRLQDNLITIFRTDVQGTIEYLFKGNKYQFNYYKP